jgi:hypothetical protein
VSVTSIQGSRRSGGCSGNSPLARFSGKIYI